MTLRRSLGTLSLAFVMYFTVSGGPFSTEELVVKVGPGMALLMLLLVPVLWSVPEALIVGELSSMLPEEGGYYRWVYRAFGPFWAFQNGWWTWAYSIVDIAIYPVLFNQYLAFFFPGLGKFWSWMVSLGLIWTATGINLRGARPVGRWSVVSGLFVMGGFFVLALAALPNVHQVPWRPFGVSGSSTLGALGLGLSIALWNYTGWDNASTVAGEVKDASRSFPRALALALPLTVLGYFVPLGATLGASNWRTWREGGWPDIAVSSAGFLGRPIAVWLAVTGMVSAVGLFNALMLSHSRVPVAMAEDGLLPPFLAKTDSRGTPTSSILVAGVLYSGFVLVPFGGLVVADVLLYSMALFLEFASLVALRRREPQLRGAFRIPLPLAGVVGLALLPVIILIIVVGLEVHDGELGLPAVIAGGGAALLGPVGYLLGRRYGRARTTAKVASG